MIDAVEKNLVSAVVFDWDRTLTKIEGLYGTTRSVKNVSEYKKNLAKNYPISFTEFGKLTDKQVVSYYFHNNNSLDIDERPIIIGILLRVLYDFNVPVLC